MSTTALTKRQAALMKRNGALTATDGRPDYKRQADWIVADISGSMGAHLSTNTLLRRIDCLNQAINSMGDDVQIIAFSDEPEYPPRTGKVAFEPKGGTMLEKALAVVNQYEPSYIVVVSDGEVWSTADSLAIAGEIAKFAVIDTLYVGPDNPSAEQFMQQLADVGHGRFKRYDLTAAGQLLSLTDKVQQLLPPPDDRIVEL